MTRAKDRLLLSGGLPGRRSRDSFLSLLEEAAGTEIGMKKQAAITIGSVSLTQTVLAAQDRSPRRLRESLDKLTPAPSCGDFLSRWADRDEAWSRLCSTPVRLTPSGLMAQQDSLSGGEPTHRSCNRGRIIGTLAHRVLELWDYQSDPSALAARVHDVCRGTIPRAGGGEAEEMSAEVVADLTDMLMTFAASAPYADLRRATILGREVPFSIPWKASVGNQEATTCLMEGVIDVLYQLDGELWVADYKTDRLEADELATRTDSYRLQAEVYGRAVSLCLKGQDVRVRLVFLRTGQSVEIGIGGSC
jgi:ATP-dependent helicase/nuclease subunit A